MFSSSFSSSVASFSNICWFGNKLEPWISLKILSSVWSEAQATPGDLGPSTPVTCWVARFHQVRDLVPQKEALIDIDCPLFLLLLFKPRLFLLFMNSRWQIRRYRSCAESCVCVGTSVRQSQSFAILFMICPVKCVCHQQLCDKSALLRDNEWTPRLPIFPITSFVGVGLFKRARNKWCFVCSGLLSTWRMKRAG